MCDNGKSFSNLVEWDSLSRIYLDKHQREMPMDKNRLPVAAVAFCKMQWYNDSKKILQRDKEGNAMELDEIYKRVQEIA